MNTKTGRINLATVGNLAEAINQSCITYDAAGYKLISTFVFENELILIFQK